MKQPSLFEMAPDQPSRKKRLRAFMKEHVIHTHAMPGPSDPECPKWTAVAMRQAWNYGYGVKQGDSIPILFSKVGRLLEESGCAQHGHTEEEAVRYLCEDYLKVKLLL